MVLPPIKEFETPKIVRKRTVLSNKQSKEIEKTDQEIKNVMKAIANLNHMSSENDKGKLDFRKAKFSKPNKPNFKLPPTRELSLKK